MFDRDIHEFQNGILHQQVGTSRHDQMRHAYLAERRDRLAAEQAERTRQDAEAVEARVTGILKRAIATALGAMPRGFLLRSSR